jgi:hypothetical protein
MAASKSMLESLLARVRQRATESRGNRPPLPEPAPASTTAATSPPPAARALAPVAVEDDVEEYDDELIEILDDDEVASESAPPSEPVSEPLELRASAPSVEMRRRAVPPSSRPNPIAARPAAAPGSAVAALRAEVVARRPVPATAVVQARATRPDPRSQSFLELLDASLDLGE